MTEHDIDTYERPSDEQTLLETVEEKCRLLSEVPGLAVEFDPEEADMSGAFVEDALSLEDAEDAVFDRTMDEVLPQ